MTGLVIGAAVLVVLLAVVVAWRLSSKGRASVEIREMERHHPPVSPYENLHRIRLIDDAASPAPSVRPAPARPRLDSRDYVFGDAGQPVSELAPPARHDTRWALAHAVRRRRRRWRSRQWMRLGVVVLILVLGAGYLLQRGHGATRPASTTTSTSWPRSFAASVTGQGSATLVVPTSNFTVTLRATRAATVQVLGPAGTYFSGSLTSGQVKTLSVSGFVTVNFVTMGVSLALDGAPVSLPSVASAPYRLTITPQG